MSNCTKKNNVIRILIGGIIIAAVGLIFVSADSLYETGINKNGKTFGSAACANNEREEPDLIAAEATNGEIGYVLKCELEEAEGNRISNPEEAVAYTIEKENKASAAFFASINEQTGEECAVDPTTYKKALEDYVYNNKSAYDVLSSIGVKTRISGSEAILQEAFKAAQTANKKTINVYKKDGKTIVGVFEVN